MGVKWRCGPSYGAVKGRHAKVGDGVLSGEFAHRGELLRGGGNAGLDRGDVTQPALLLRLVESVDEVGVDLLQSWLLSWVNPKQRASDTRISCAQGVPWSRPHVPSATLRNRVGEEVLPLPDCEVAVFLAWPLGPAAGDERPMVRDHVLGVDRGVSHRRVHSGVTADLGRDVRAGRSGWRR